MPDLPRDDVHLWLSCPDEASGGELLRQYRSLLEPQELEKGARFYFERDRHRHLVTRALVRVVLSKYVPAIEPGQWRFGANAHGCPFIANGDPLAQRLRFNVSHTAGLVALAVACDKAVGVDVESLRRKSNAELADHYFAGSEAASLQALDAPLRHGRFFDFWTLKESYIKARGMGLSIPLDQFAFDLADEGKIGFCTDARLGDAPERWSFAQFKPSADHIGALCVEQAPAAALSFTATRIVALQSESPLDCAVLRRSG